MSALLPSLVQEPASIVEGQDPLEVRKWDKWRGLEEEKKSLLIVVAVALHSLLAMMQKQISLFLLKLMFLHCNPGLFPHLTLLPPPLMLPLQRLTAQFAEDRFLLPRPRPHPCLQWALLAPPFYL